MRKTKWGRLVLRLLDRPIWVYLAYARMDRVRVRMLSHAAYYLTPSGPEGALTTTFSKVVLSRPTRTFVDVGANIGSYTWTFLTLIPDGQVISIEPDPSSLHLLRATANRWGRSVEIHGAALSNEAGSAYFGMASFDGHRSSLQPVPGDDVIVVRTLRLDDVVGHRQVDIVKIDVEGHEAQVLGGAQETIARSKPCLIVECFHEPPNCLEPIRQLGYELFDGEQGGRANERTSNYLALPTDARPVA